MQCGLVLGDAHYVLVVVDGRFLLEVKRYRFSLSLLFTSSCLLAFWPLFLLVLFHYFCCCMSFLPFYHNLCFSFGCCSQDWFSVRWKSCGVSRWVLALDGKDAIEVLAWVWEGKYIYTILLLVSLLAFLFYLEQSLLSLVSSSLHFSLFVCSN